MNRIDNRIVWSLAFDMNLCRSTGVSFTACLKEARKLFNKEVATDALTRPMPPK